MLPRKQLLWGFWPFPALRVEKETLVIKVTDFPRKYLLKWEARHTQNQSILKGSICTSYPIYYVDWHSVSKKYVTAETSQMCRHSFQIRYASIQLNSTNFYLEVTNRTKPWKCYWGAELLPHVFLTLTEASTVRSSLYSSVCFQINILRWLGKFVENMVALFLWYNFFLSLRCFTAAFHTFAVKTFERKHCSMA